MDVAIPETRKTSVATANGTTIKSSAGYVHWVAATNTHATSVIALFIRDGATTMDNNSVYAGNVMFQRFDPPLRHETNINIQVAGSGTLSLTIGYE